LSAPAPIAQQKAAQGFFCFVPVSRMKKISKYLLITTGSVLAAFLLLLIASWIWLATLDLQAQRARIETLASQTLSRDVHIDGPLKLSASLFPSVSAENVRIANPRWAARQDFVAVKQLQVQINPWVLLRRKLEIRNVELTGVTVYLQRKSEQEATWTFGSGTKQGPSPGVIPDIVSLHATDVVIMYNPMDRPPFEVNIDELQASLVHDEPVTISLKGKARNFPLSIELHGGNFAGLFVPGMRWPFEGTLGTDIQDLNFEGYVSDLSTLNGIELRSSSDMQKQRGLLLFGRRTTPLLDRYRVDFNLHNEEGNLVAALSSELRGLDSSRWYEPRLRQSKPALKIREMKIDARGKGKSLGQLIQSVAFEMTGAGIQYRSPGSVTLQQFNSVRFDALRATSRSGSGFKLSARGTVGDKPLQLSASSNNALFSLWRSLEIPLDMDIQADAVKAHFSGRILEPLKHAALDGKASLKTENLTNVGTLVGKKWPSSGALAVSGDLRYADQALTLSDIQARMGTQKIDGSFTVGFGNGMDISLNAHADHLDVHGVMQHSLVPDNLVFGLNDLDLNVQGKGETFLQSLMGSDLQITADGGRLGWKTKPAKGEYLSILHEVRFSMHDPEPVKLAAQVVYDKMPFKLDAQAGPFGELLDQAQPYPLDLHLTTKGLSVSLQSMLQKPLADINIVGDMKAEGRLPVIGQLINIKLARDQPADLHGHLAATGGTLKLTGIVANTDGIKLNGDLSYQTANSPRLAVNLSGGNIDLAPYLPKKAKPGQNKAASRPPDARIVPDIALDFSKENALDAAVSINDLKVRNKDTPLTVINARFSAEKGVFRLDPVETHSAIDGSSIHARMEIDGSTNPAIGSVALQADNFNFGEVIKRLGITEDVTGTLNLQIDASGKGETLRELIGSANGKVQLIADKGSIPKWLLEIWGGGLLRLIIPTTWAEDPKTDLNCAVARFDVADGVMRSKTLLADTKRVTIAGEAVVNWQNEQISAIFKPQPKDPTLFHLGTPIQLSGTLAHPKVGSAQSGIITLGKWAIGLTSPAALIVVFGDVGAKEKNPCAALLKEPAQQ
jgi:hypothetical protein